MKIVSKIVGCILAILLVEGVDARGIWANKSSFNCGAKFPQDGNLLLLIHMKIGSEYFDSCMFPNSIPSISSLYLIFYIFFLHHPVQDKQLIDDYLNDIVSARVNLYYHYRFVSTSYKPISPDDNGKRVHNCWRLPTDIHDSLVTVIRTRKYT